jgi:putative ABC transport system ATP-binding protein
VKTLLHAFGLVPVEGMQPLDFELSTGVSVCLVGHDHGLRSAYIHTLAGAHYPWSGDLKLLGHRLSTLDDRRWLLLRREVGLVTREAPLVSSLDAMRNVMLPALYHGVATRSESAQRAHDLLERLGFEGAVDRLPAFLGERDRNIVALARALMLAPRLLFVDDPLHDLQASQARPIAQAVMDWCRDAASTLVYASDDPAVMRRADCILFIAPPVPRLFASWQAFHTAGDEDVQAYLSEFRTEARAFD